MVPLPEVLSGLGCRFKIKNYCFNRQNEAYARVSHGTSRATQNFQILTKISGTSIRQNYLRSYKYMRARASVRAPATDITPFDEKGYTGSLNVLNGEVLTQETILLKFALAKGEC